MAPKPKSKPARFAFTVGTVLAMALTILMIMADRDLAQPSLSPIYHFCFCTKGTDMRELWSYSVCWVWCSQPRSYW
jgi:hypothetical protein